MGRRAMTGYLDKESLAILGVATAIVAAGSVVSRVLRARAGDNPGATLANLSARVRAWWAMIAFLAAAFALGRAGTVVFFGLLSFLALREFITLNPTRRGDHRALFWCFFVITPLQYFLVAVPWYGLFLILIPVYAFVFIPLRITLAGETERFLERTAKIQWGLLVCVYFVSHIPMLLEMPIPGYEGENAKLILFFIFVVQISDVLQYVWGKTLGKRRLSAISPNKTLEGFVLGVLSASLLGLALWWATPFSPIEAFAMALVAALAGFAGGLILSAIKRDLGVKDWGQSIEGHGGVLDRIDSLCFAAPLFFHLTGYYFGTGIRMTSPDWLRDVLRIGQ